eukprot:14457283-Ditylum_brightwellii.AAC.1
MGIIHLFHAQTTTEEKQHAIVNLKPHCNKKRTTKKNANKVQHNNKKQPNMFTGLKNTNFCRDSYTNVCPATSAHNLGTRPKLQFGSNDNVPL